MKQLSLFSSKAAAKKAAPKKAAAKKAAPKKAAAKKPLQQRGSSDIERDAERQALPLGKRKSASGKTYYETRANRTDLTSGKKRGYMLGIGKIFDTDALMDLDALKKQYFKLAKIYHPDAGGNKEQFQALQNEYEILFKKLLSGAKLSSEQKTNETVIDTEIRKIIDEIILLDGITIELIGQWLWIGGNTYPLRTVLKQCGLSFIKKAGVPYWVYKGVPSSSRGKTSMEDIKNKYGVHKFDLKQTKKISGVKKISKVRLKFALMKLKRALNHRLI